MNIKRVELKSFGKYNLKSFTLGEVNLVKGKNGSGKSTIVEAINYALTGEIRRLPKKNEELIKMSTNGIAMSVSVNFDNIDISRELSKGKKISESLLVNGLEEETIVEKQNFLNKEFYLDKMLLNPINFLQLSGTDKGKYLMEFVTNTTTTKENVIKSLENKVPMAILTELVFDDEVSILENIDNNIKEIGSSKRSLSKEYNSILENRSRLMDLELKIDSTTIAPTKIEDLQQEVNELELKIKKGADMNLKKRELLERKAQIEEFLKSNSEKSVAAKMDSLNKELLTLNNDCDLNELTDKITKEMKTLESIKESGISLKNLTNNLVNSFNEVVQLEDKVAKIDTCKKCVISDDIICLNTKGFESAIKSFEAKKLALKETKLEQEFKLKEMVANYKKQNNIVNSLISKQRELSNKMMDKSKRSNEIFNEITRLNKSKVSIEKNKSILIEIDRQLQQITAGATDPLMIKILETKKAELSELRVHEVELAKVKEYSKLIEVENIKLQEYNLKGDNLKLLEKSLKAEKLALIENGIRPLLKDINEFLGRMDFPFVAFVKNDGKKATLGLSSNGKETEISTLSTGETMILMIALVGGIYRYKKSNFKPLFIDDIDNLDMANLQKLLFNIDILKEFFDTVIFIGVLENLDTSNLEDVNVIKF